jgi:hypothetical protein
VQPTVSKGKTGALASAALQDVLSSQAFVLLGLIANLTGTTLQEDIAETGHRLLRLGYDIAQGDGALEGGSHAYETPVVPGAPAPGAGPVQLGGSPSGP